MRTMFISLVLIWSLAQLASAQPPPLPTATKFHPEGCGTIYKCYAPAICNDKDVISDPLESGSIEEIETRFIKEIASDCPALIKFHSYDTHSLFVSIESFQETTEINSILFLQTTLQNTEKNKFSCEIATGEKMIGKYKTSERYSEEIADRKHLKCEFKVTRRKDNAADADFFNSHPNDGWVFVVSTKVAAGRYELKNSKIFRTATSPFLLRCNPKNLQLSETDDNTMIYAQVHYDIDKKSPIYCKNLDNSWIEYIPKGKKEYDKVHSSKCQNDAFIINNDMVNYFNQDEFIDIRCVAKVQYACNYEVKQHAQLTTPKYTPPNIAGKIPTKMECQPDEPYLNFADGRQRPIKNPTFECMKYGTTQYWTVNKIPLTKEGPEVYCSKEVKCHIFWTMSESAIKEGYVSNKNFLPNCYDKTGTMKTETESGLEVVSNPRCDGVTGKFMYTVGGKDKEMDANTKFVCDYPKDTTASEIQNKKNKEVLTVAISIAAGVALIILAAACGGFWMYNARENKKMKKELEERNNAENELWGTKSEQAKAKRLKMEKNKGNNSSHGSEETKENLKKMRWNDQVTRAQSTAINATSPNTETPNKNFNKLEGKTSSAYAKHIPSAKKIKLYPQDAVFIMHKDRATPGYMKGGIKTALRAREGKTDKRKSGENE